MNSARVTLSETTTSNAKAIEIYADDKSTAQGAIKLAQSWIRSNGGRYKLVTFTSTPSEWSNLVLKFRARIVFAGA